MSTITVKESDLAQIAAVNPQIAALVRKMGAPGMNTTLEKSFGVDVVLVGSPGAGGTGGGSDQGGTTPPATDRELACFLYDNAKVTTHTLLSTKVSDDAAKAVIARNLKDGCNTIYVSVANDRDYGDFPVRLNASTAGLWKTRLDLCRAAGLRIVAWGRQDDSSQLDKLSDKDLFAYWTNVHENFGSYFAHWVTCLEIDEVLKDAARAQRWTAELRKITGRKIGVHTTSAGNVHFAKGADLFYGQISTKLSANEAVAKLASYRKAFGGPVIMAEFNRSSDSAAARKVGDALLDSGAAGVGTGFTPGRVSESPTTGTGILLAARWNKFPRVDLDAPEIEGWKTKVVDGTPCVGQLFLDGKKVEWIGKGRQWSTVKNALNKSDGRYYRPGFAAQKTCTISVADVDGKNESNRITLEKPVS